MPQATFAAVPRPGVGSVPRPAGAAAPAPPGRRLAPPPLRSGAEAEGSSSNMLHVRGVGGALEDEDALAALFRQCGTVVQATVRHRIDATSGLNTSWALVTMVSRAEAQRALGQTFVSPEGRTLQVSSFDQKQADRSTGAMGSVRLAAAAKMIQSRWRQKRAWEDTVYMSMGQDFDADAGQEVGLGALIAARGLALSPSATRSEEECSPNPWRGFGSLDGGVTAIRNWETVMLTTHRPSPEKLRQWTALAQSRPHRRITPGSHSYKIARAVLSEGVPPPRRAQARAAMRDM
jgi:hypothetical protein|eukprot:SAG25_NODE_738_length_5631_cov_4.919480_6_plen_291_part_00